MLFQDFRYALRSLAKNAGFTIAAVVTLALGIGANTAVFSLVRGVLLRSLPYPRSERLVAIYGTNVAKSALPITASPPDFLDWRAQNRSFTAMGAYTTSDYALSEGGEPEWLHGTMATPGLFETLGVAPLHGRAFGDAEAVKGRDRVAVLGHGLWVRRFGSDANVVGRTIRLDGEDYRVLGVMPAGFRFPTDGADIWTPLAFRPDVGTQRGAHYLDVVARMRDGVTLAAAKADLASIAGRLRAQYRSTNEGYGASAAPLREMMVGSIRPTLNVLLGAVAFVTLLACANVANLLLIRAARRGPEIAVRTALGAGRSRIIRQLLTESLVLALAGAAAGLALAGAAIDLIVRLGPADIPRLSDVRIDGGVLGYTVAWTVAAALLAGLAPAIAAIRPGSMTLLRGIGADAFSRRGQNRLRHLLVVGQIGIALLLLTGAGLLARSFARLSSVDPGFRAASVLTYEISLPDSRYPDAARTGAFTQELLARMKALPGVRSAGAIFGLPLSGLSFSSSFTVAGAPVDEALEPSAQIRVASRDYFATVGIPLVAGRLFAESDRAGSPGAILASRSAARKFWPEGNALGHHVRFGARPGTTQLEGEIVGIVDDVRDAGLSRGPIPEFYASMEQAPTGYFSVVVLASGEPGLLATAARRELKALDAELPLTQPEGLQAVVNRSFASRRFAMLLLLGFAGIAVVLAAVGIYGVIAYTVGQRTREIGIRLALGADVARVRRLILRDGLRLAAAGLLAGTAAALGLTRLLTGLLFEVRPADPPTYVAVAALLFGIALLACWIPARRAARLDPTIALRAE